MSTGIEWCDETWNPVTGCTKVSPGCQHCYAEGLARRLWRGRPFTDVRFHADRLLTPLSWRKRRAVFVNSMSDLFHEDVGHDELAAIFAVMALAREHLFLVLTKRPERMRGYVVDEKHLPRIRDAATAMLALKDRPPPATWPFQLTDEAGWFLPNVWLGVSAENQHYADARIPLLLDTPAARRFVSIEPLLASVNLLKYLPPTLGVDHEGNQPPGLDWVIVGGESGRSARICDVCAVEDIVEDCRRHAVSCFVKQLGARPGVPRTMFNQGYSIPMRDDRELSGLEFVVFAPKDAKGGDPNYWPRKLRVRERPAFNPEENHA